MYHIKMDRRSQASAAQIVRGLQECLKTTPLKSVTISDLHRTTGISRATIYRLFDTPEDVLIYQLDQTTEKAAEAYKLGGGLSSRELLEETIRLGLQNHEFLLALVENGRLDLLFRYTERNFRSMEGLADIIPINIDRVERDYIIAHLSMSMVASQIAWSRNGQQDSPGDLIHYLKRYTEIVSSLIAEG